MIKLAQKIKAKFSNQLAAKLGNVVLCAVDLAIINDSGGPRRVKPILEKPFTTRAPTTC